MWTDSTRAQRGHRASSGPLCALREPVSRLLAQEILEETQRDLLAAYRRVMHGEPLLRDELAARVVRELHRMATEGDVEGEATT